MQSYVYVLGSAAGGGRCECMRRKESASGSFVDGGWVRELQNPQLLKTHIDPHSDGVIITFSLPPLCR